MPLHSEHSSDDPQHVELRQFVEDFSIIYERWELPRIGAKIIGYLLVCDPPHKTQQDLAAFLDVSMGSVSTMVRLVEQLGLIERVSVPGERRTLYRIRRDVWTRSVEEHIQRGASLRSIADRGLELLNGESAERRERLEAVRDYASFWSDQLPTLLEKWNEMHARSDGHD